MGRLSLCMIVRDEQEMLPDFLASVAGIWDELIVVDTGSRDDTCRLLTGAGAHLLHHQWQDDFAAARNIGLDTASGDWILFLDADERCTVQLGLQICALLEDDQAGAATLVMRNKRPDGTHRDTHLLRLFRNSPDIRFRHRIHEDPSTGVRNYLYRTGLELRRLTGVVNHLGYLRDVASARGKRDRDTKLLQCILKTDPDDMYCWFKLMEQARFWKDEQTWRQAARDCLPRFENALAGSMSAEPWADEFTALLAQGLHDEPRDGLQWFLGLPEKLRKGPAVQLRRGLWLEETGHPGEAEQAFLACQNGESRTGTDTMFTLRSAMGLCRIKAAGGNLPEAWSQAAEACRACPTDPEALLAAVAFVPSHMARVDWIATHLSDHPEATPVMAQTLQACGLTDLASALTQLTPG